MESKEEFQKNAEMCDVDTLKQICQRYGLVDLHGNIVVEIRENGAIMLKELSVFDGECYRQLYFNHDELEFCKKILEMYKKSLEHSKSKNSDVVKRTLLFSNHQ